MVNCRSRPETKKNNAALDKHPDHQLVHFVHVASKCATAPLFKKKKKRREGNKQRETTQKMSSSFLSFVLFIRFDSIGFSVRWKSITFYTVYHSSSLLYIQTSQEKNFVFERQVPVCSVLLSALTSESGKVGEKTFANSIINEGENMLKSF